jgi:hypothetical protein
MILLAELALDRDYVSLDDKVLSAFRSETTFFSLALCSTRSIHSYTMSFSWSGVGVMCGCPAVNRNVLNVEYLPSKV